MSFKDTEIGKIPLDWEIAELGELADVLSGYAFKGKDFVDYGIPVIKIKNIVPPYVSIDDVQYVSEQIFNESKKYQLKYNDILISMTGSNYNQMSSAVGKVGKIRLNNTPMLLNQRVGKIIPNENLCNKEFIYYNISTMETRYRLALSAGGSANQANISPKQIKSLKIPIPPIEEQKAIAHILSTLDEKIEVNNQINKTLENMAQAIFKQWFVDFEFPNEDGEPYKSSGGEMVESELGMIPKGWEVRNLKEIADMKNGVNYGRDQEGKEIKVVNVRDFDGAMLVNDYKLDKVFLSDKQINDYLLSIFDTIVVRSAKPGETLLVMNELDKVYSGFTIRVRAKEDQNKIYLFNCLRRGMEVLNNSSNGTVFKNLNQQILGSLKINLPHNEIINKFNRVIKPLFRKINHLMDEIVVLIQIRDTLLPKLMSGEIRVPLDEEGETS
jgi:type I restriction enzyme S subunit